MKRRIRRPRLGVRARITVGFSLLALVVSLGLAFIAQSLARNRLLENQNSNAETVALLTAPSAAIDLRKGVEPAVIVRGLRPATDAGFVAIRRGNEIFSDEPSLTNIDALPPGVAESMRRGDSFRVRTQLGPAPYLLVVVQLKGVDNATFLQAFPITELARTLGFLNTSLAVGATVATLGGAGLGWWASRRVLSPLARVADAASQLARSAEATSQPESSGLRTRLDESDRELQRLAASFNDMVDAVQNRILREQRFASDVSHELRTPLQAMLTSIDVLENRRLELPERSQQALSALTNQTRRFDRMVRDLLEISRLDAGAADLYTEPVLVDQFVVRVAGRYDCSHVPVIVSPMWQHTPVMADRRRLEQVLANLLVNARNHGDGPTRITIDGGRSPAGRTVARIGVEDSGPGVAPGDRLRIFERFARGAAARQRGDQSKSGSAGGTGLGLALVHEHVQLLAGRVWVEDRPDGQPGARFVVELPAQDPSDDQ